VRARELLDRLRRDLAPTEEAIRRHPYLEAVERGRAPVGSLRQLACEQYWIVSSDRRSFAHLASRFPEPPAGDLFLAMAQGEGEALRRLSRLASSLELSARELASFRPAPLCHAYTGYVAWLALNGSRADVAAAFLVNLAAWGASCRRLAEALRPRCDVSFFELFATPSPDFEEQALAVVEQGLTSGDAPEGAERAAALLQAYELAFWDGLARAL